MAPLIRSRCNFFAQLLTMLHRNPLVLSFSPLLLPALFFHCSSATQFTVGDSSGWGIPPYPTYYSNWSQSQFLRVGDSLEFNFDARFYNLVQVSPYEYEHCTSFNVVKFFNSSPAVVPLTERGIFFFVCNISNYCCLGQKVAVSVHECSSPTPLSPSPSAPPPATSPSATPSGLCCTVQVATSPSPPGGSSINSMPSPSGNGDGGYSPEPSTSLEEKSMGVSLVQATNYSFSVKNLFTMFVTFLGFLVI